VKFVIEVCVSFSDRTKAIVARASIALLRTHSNVTSIVPYPVIPLERGSHPKPTQIADALVDTVPIDKCRFDGAGARQVAGCE